VTLVLAAVAAMLLAASNDVLAVPSFARQTGMACEACHTVFPELTPFGRQFKLNGYLIDNLPQIKDVTPEKKDALLLNWLPPLSLQFITSYTKFKTAVPDPNGGLSQNGTVQFPEQASLFYGGRIAPKLGGFIQLTYSNSNNQFGWDNTDIRFADQGRLAKENLTWGLTFNNAPTVQDAWNSTPGWKYPFAQTSSLTPLPAAALTGLTPVTQLDGIGNGTVAGLGAYGYWNNLVYLELGGYGAAPHGVSAPLNSQFTGEVVHGFSPYWRIAVEPRWGRQSLEMGLVGFADQIVPQGLNVQSAPTNRYTDTAFDAQYQYIGDDNILSAELTYIYEKQTLHATLPADASNNLKTFRLGGSYFHQRQWGGSLGYFSTTGNTNPALYPGSTTGRPNTAGWAAELDYLPWLNVKLALQYTFYTKFDGASKNFNGSGRNASDNNTLYIYAWFAF
jgi:hypothetical protein